VCTLGGCGDDTPPQSANADSSYDSPRAAWRRLLACTRLRAQSLRRSLAKKKGTRMGALVYLAAAAVVVAATVVAAVVAAPHVAAAAVTEQEDQNNDPANITAAETVIVTHRIYLRKSLQRPLPLIPRYSGRKIWCKKSRCSVSTGFIRFIPTDRPGTDPAESAPSALR